MQLPPFFMPNIFSLIRESWDFCRKQQALTHVGLWFLFVPNVLGGILEYFHTSSRQLFETTPELNLTYGMGTLALTLFTLWGTICVMNIGKRLLQAKSGRSRSSFKTVIAQSRALFIPFVLTSILRGIMVFFWSIPAVLIGLFIASSLWWKDAETLSPTETTQLTLLIVGIVICAIPAIIYSIRTGFYSIVAVCEGIMYRPALHRSQAVVKGRLLHVFLTMFWLGILVLLPAEIATGIFTAIADGAPIYVIISAIVASSIVSSVATTIYILCLIQAYGHFKPMGHVSN